MTKHERLLQDYARELREKKAAAEKWWGDLSTETRRQANSPEAAARILQSRWPDGPASHPLVLATIRKYWLACEALNEESEREERSEAPPPEPDYVLEPDEDDDERGGEEENSEEDDEVYPHIFVLEWLMTDEHDDLATFLGTLSYWPIGLDDNDRYV